MDAEVAPQRLFAAPGPSAAALGWRRPARTPPLECPVPLAPGESFEAPVVVNGQRFDRTVVCTRWMAPGLDVGAFLRDTVGQWLRPGDLVSISEKAVVVATGRGVPAATVHPSRLARFVARRVRPRGNSRGLSIPEKAQLVIDTVGAWRVLLAVAAAGCTRPLGIHGAFYVVAGYVARCTDGMRPPYHDMLLPPLPPRTARSLAQQLAMELGHAVAIVDMNDRGGSVRAVAGSVLSARQVAAVLADNPLGQRDRGTPIVVVRQNRPVPA